MHYEIRRVRPSDAPALREFYEALSAESRRARFLGAARGPEDAGARAFCNLDHMHEEGFVAVSSAADVSQILGHVCLVHAGTGRLELAIAVADRIQGRGIGRRLFETAIRWARDRGYREIVACAFADNSRVLRLLSSAPHGARVAAADSGVVDVSIPLVAALPRPWTLSPARARAAVRRSRRMRPSHHTDRAACLHQEG